MKYGVNTIVSTTRVMQQHEPLFSRIREWGFGGVELFLSLDEPSDLPAITRILDGLGLTRTACSVLPREANLISADRQVCARGIEFLKRCVERTAELGDRFVCGPLYTGLGVMTGRRRTEDEWKWSVEGLQAAAAKGRELGVMLCIEPLNRSETHFLNTLEDTAKASA